MGPLEFESRRDAQGTESCVALSPCSLDISRSLSPWPISLCKNEEECTQALTHGRQTNALLAYNANAFADAAIHAYHRSRAS